MPKTRSQAADEKTTRVFEEPPASPMDTSVEAASVPASASASASASAAIASRANHERPHVPPVPAHRIEPVTPRTAAATTTATAPTVAAAAAPDDRRRRAPSVRSVRSNASASVRIRQAELEAQERLAELQRREMQLETELIRKRLALEVATIREETDRDTVIGNEVAEVDKRIDEWVKGTHTSRAVMDTNGPAAARERTPVERRGEQMGARPRREDEELRSQRSFYQYGPTPREVTSRRERSPAPDRGRRSPPPARRRKSPTPDRRYRSPTPGRSRERGIDRLAEVLERMALRRPPPRQAQELPCFSGAPNEWLLFKTAMRDSTKMYGYTQAENLARLRTCLKGEAREAVAALLYTAAEPDVIMHALERCYGRPEILIDKALNDIQRLPRPGTTASELNTFAVKLQNIVGVLSCIDERGYLQNPMLARQVTEKLSPHLRARWCDYAEAYVTREEAEIVTLSRFLMREADRAVRYGYTTNVPSTSREPTRNVIAGKRNAPPPPRPASGRRRSVAAYAAGEKKTQNEACICCGAAHLTSNCHKLKAMTVPERWGWAREARVCYLCLNSKHRRRTCTAPGCDISGCRRAHHTLLHGLREATPEKKEDVTAVANTVQSTGAVLLKVCPVRIRGPEGLEVDTYALLDEGSTITLVDEEIASAVNVRGEKHPLRLQGLTATCDEAESQSVVLEMKGTGTTFHPIRARTVRCLSINSQTIKASCLRYKHLQQLPVNEVCYEDARPRVLIGADNWHLIVSRKLLVGKRSEPAASLTELGWVVHGTVPRTIVAEENPVNGDTVLYTRSPEHKGRVNNELLSELVTSHFKIDALGVSSKRKPVAEDVRAVQIFENTVRNVDGHYEVGLPWKTDDTRLPPSYDMAFSRLRSMERKMDKDEQFRHAYTRQIENLLVKGYAQPVDNGKPSPVEWYLPHFAVTNPNKPGKVRLVFDAAAVTNGRCLNDELLAGPDMLQALHGVLFRFREKPIAITADIREMFLQVKIRKEDRAAQRFLWRGDERTAPPRKYEMSSMIFGARSSPFLAHSVRNKNAEECAQSHPRALYAITRNHYMDDWVDCFEDEETATRTIEEVRQVHKRAGFVLTGWNTNGSRVLEHIKEEDRATAPKALGANAHPYEKTLGMIWIPETDEFAFNTTMPRVPTDVRDGIRPPTKREMLAAVMSIFDPLGLLSPFTITAKIVLQELWRKTVGWDAQLPADEAIAFLPWINGLTSVAGLRVPRRYAEHRPKELSLHVFTDASEQAYAAVAYWRITQADGSVKIALVAGKARVAPLKAQSIPRMELQACLIGARLAAEILREHRWKAEVTYWSDSKTALHWIRNDSSRYPPYVAHRLSEIAELTTVEQWRWVPTSLNVADDATRYRRTRLTNDDRWFVGPEFLRDPEHAWPMETRDEEEEPTVAHATSAEGLVNMERFSSYNRMLRAVANVLLFADKCRKRAKQLELRHLNEAEIIIIREAQRASFPGDLARLAAGKPVEGASRLKKLDPTYGSDGIIRLHGRIDVADVPQERKRPPILDGKHPLARLIIKQEHEKYGHAGREHVVNNLRQRWWILKIRTVVRRVLNDCCACRRRRRAAPVPVKGDLPYERLDAHTRPFTRCGVDCFGPMTVTIGRRREKRWGMLFTCLVTRAVHIEVIPGLSTDSAIMALRRMAARRGWPRTIMSDNGTNFRGADVEIKKAYEEWARDLREYALTQAIEWKFIAPGAPNQGGAWERMVRSVKTALAVVLKERAPKEEVLNTVMAEAEYTVNSRPLTHVSVSPEDPEALTPNHFLLGSATGMPVVGQTEVADKRAWRAAQALADQFWARWLAEYLPTLAPRGDVRSGSARNIQEGDVVVIADGLLPRNVWPQGQVVRAIAGPDGVVRCAGRGLQETREKAHCPDAWIRGSRATPGGDCYGQQHIRRYNYE